MYHGPNIILATGITVHGFRDKEQMGITLNLPMAFVNFIGTLRVVSFRITATLADEIRNYSKDSD